MSKPDVTVEVGIFNGFQLDDPEFGVLDEGVLDGGIDYTEVPQGLVSVSTSRGRNRDIGKTSAGSLSVSLRNEDRFFNPLSGSAFSSLVRPRLPIRVSADSVRVFTGFVDDWDFTYSPGGQSSASVEATDAFSRFARNINGGGSAVVESSGARLNRVLDQLEVNWPSGERDIDTGQATLAAGVLEGEALGYMLDVVEQSELGLLFMSKSGDVAFRSRLLEASGSPVTFSDSGNGVPFSNVEVAYGAEDLVNQAIITGPSGTAISEDIGSQTLFGITAEEIDTQVSTLAQQESIADFLIEKFSQPELRVQAVTVNMQALTPAQQSQVLGLEIGDQVGLDFTPNGIPPAFEIANRVIGISHDVGLSSHFVTFNLREAPFLYFVLDSAQFGTLDNEDVVLGF
jgi:hypothetical protein